MMHVRPAINTLDDAEAFCALYHSLYARRITREYVAWQFFETPFPTQLHLAIDERGQLAGTYGIQCVDLPGGGVVAWAIDIMVAPPHQGRGVFRALAEAAAAAASQHRPVTLAVLANARAEPAHVGGLGWTRVKSVPTLSMPIAAAGGGGRSTAARQLLPREIGQWFAAIRQEAGEFHDARAGKARTAAFADWRFTRCPLQTYEVYGAPADGAIGALLALKIFTDPAGGTRSGDIVDLQWRRDSVALVPDLIRDALGRFAALGVSRAAGWLDADTPPGDVGRQAGFAPTDQRKYLCCRVLDARYAWLLDARRWSLSMADTEAY